MLTPPQIAAMMREYEHARRSAESRGEIMPLDRWLQERIAYLAFKRSQEWRERHGLSETFSIVGWRRALKWLEPEKKATILPV